MTIVQDPTWHPRVARTSKILVSHADHQVTANAL